MVGQAEHDENSQCILITKDKLLIKKVIKKINILLKKIPRKLSHLTITARRAETLNAIPYDGDIAKIRLPEYFSHDWLHATANPALDLRFP